MIHRVSGVSEVFLFIMLLDFEVEENMLKLSSICNENGMMLNYSLLVVDDSRLNREFIGSLFRSKGISIIFAKNGHEAIEAANSQVPDLILLDVIMPELDGYAVCERLKESEGTKNIPVIFLTSRTQTADLVKGFALGAVDYVNKPFKKEELISRVLTHLELKKSRDMIEEQKKQLKLKNMSVLEHFKMVEKLNQELQEKNAIQQELIQTKDKFFSIISHDLRGPLGNIITFADLILEGFANFGKDQLLKTVQLLKDSTVTSVKLLENLLEWARSQTGALHWNPVKLEICTLLRNLKEEETKTAKLKQIELQLNGCEEYFVFGDEAMLKTIMRNLISNAIKFTPKGGSIMINYIEIVVDSKAYMEVEVKDSGLGMKEEMLSNLFKINTNRSTRGTEGEKGTGLGLILCKEFVEKNKGNIYVKSKIGEGSSFVFSIPKYIEKD